MQQLMQTIYEITGIHKRAINLQTAITASSVCQAGLILKPHAHLPHLPAWGAGGSLLLTLIVKEKQLAVHKDNKRFAVIFAGGGGILPGAYFIGFPISQV